MKKHLILFTNIIFFILIFNISPGECFWDGLKESYNSVKDKIYNPDKNAKKELLKWNKSNQGMISFEMNGLSNFRKQRKSDSGYIYYLGFHGVKITNNSDDYIEAIIIPINFYSKDSLMFKKNFYFYLEIFPTGTIEINQYFNMYDDFLYRLKQQLGEKYAWGSLSDEVLFIPNIKAVKYKSGSDFNADFDIYDRFRYDPDKQFKKRKLN